MTGDQTKTKLTGSGTTPVLIYQPGDKFNSDKPSIRLSRFASTKSVSSSATVT